MEKKYDIGIIGGGPAGSTAACCLARAGHSVLLLDRREFPRPKLCAGLLTWKTLNLLHAAFGIPPETLATSGVIHHRSRKYSIHGPSGLLVSGELEYPFHFVSRSSYDHYWLKAAESSGAEIHLGDALAQVDPHTGRIVTRSGMQAEVRIIIGADGANSLVRRTLFRKGVLADHWERGLATALEAFVQDPALRTSSPALYFGCIPWGYGWSFPGKEHQILGICGLKSRTRGSFTARFSRFLTRLGVDPKSCRIKAHPLPYGNRVTPPGWGRVLLVGDACGLVDPFLGEGIYYAHASGMLAAQAAAAHCARGSDPLRSYEQALSSTLIPELRYAAMWRRLTFTVLQRFDYLLLGWMVQAFKKRLEGTIHGRRSFRWLRPVEPITLHAGIG